MKLLSESTNAALTRLADLEHEASMLLSELDTLEVRLQRVFEAVSLDSLVLYLNIERKQILEDEKRAEISASLAGFPALGIYGLFSLFSGRKPNWGRAFSEAFREEPFGDVRVVASCDSVKVVNVSGIAREQNMTTAAVIAYLEAKGNKVLIWSGFEAMAKNLRMAILRGEVRLLEEEGAKLRLKPDGLLLPASSENRPGDQ
jgi:hypothetical protein